MTKKKSETCWSNSSSSTGINFFLAVTVVEVNNSKQLKHDPHNSKTKQTVHLHRQFSGKKDNTQKHQHKICLRTPPHARAHTGKKTLGHIQGKKVQTFASLAFTSTDKGNVAQSTIQNNSTPMPAWTSGRLGSKCDRCGRLLFGYDTTGITTASCCTCKEKQCFASLHRGYVTLASHRESKKKCILISSKILFCYNRRRRSVQRSSRTSNLAMRVINIMPMWRHADLF